MAVTQEKIRTVNVTRYVMPLREGGSLPGLVEADDDFLYVLKFKGAGQGVKALVAELIAGELARALDFKVPEIVFAHLDAAFGRIEGDEEIQDLLKASEGLNMALHYLSGAITFDPLVNPIDPLLASKIVWFDNFVTNTDRTAKNTNMLMWNRELWLIDHGATFLFHHNWQNSHNPGKKTFSYIKDHVMLPSASKLEEANEEFTAILTDQQIESIVSLVPDEWLTNEGSPEKQRQVYIDFLKTRLSNSGIFINEVQDARKALI